MCRNHGVVDIEPPDDTTYEDDAYTYIDHHLPIYSDIYKLLDDANPGGHAPTPTGKMDLEMEFFTGNIYGGIRYGFNMNPSVVCPERV